MMAALAAPARSVNAHIFTTGMATVATLAAVVRVAGGVKVIVMEHVCSPLAHKASSTVPPIDRDWRLASRRSWGTGLSGAEVQLRYPG